MRTIKFRGKSEIAGGWIYGYYFSYQSIMEETPVYSIVPPEYSSRPMGYFHVNPETVGQFTGVLDKNGKEIYEGDILLIDSEGSMEIYNEVGIKDGCFGYIGENTGELLPFCLNKVTEEIVGNIHDTPELLKKSIKKR